MGPIVPPVRSSRAVRLTGPVLLAGALAVVGAGFGGSPAPTGAVARPARPAEGLPIPPITTSSTRPPDAPPAPEEAAPELALPPPAAETSPPVRQAAAVPDAAPGPVPAPSTY